MINIYRFKISSFDKQKMSALRPIRIVAGPTDQSFQITPPPSLLIVVAVGPLFVVCQENPPTSGISAHDGPNGSLIAVGTVIAEVEEL